MQNDKLWLVVNGSQSPNKKQKIYRSESALLKALGSNNNQEVIELCVLSRTSVDDFLKSKSRDAQLRSILNELDNSEESAIRLVNFYKENAPDGIVYKMWNNKKETQKDRFFRLLDKYQYDKKALSSLLVKHKSYFLTTMTSVEWYKILLDCHNFMTLSGKATEEMNINFKEAKLQRRKKK